MSLCVPCERSHRREGYLKGWTHATLLWLASLVALLGWYWPVVWRVLRIP